MTVFAGTWPLTRLILRRDRVIMPAWVLVMALLPLSLASATAALYTTDAAQQGYIDDLAKSELLIMVYGPKPPPSLGALIFCGPRRGCWSWRSSVCSSSSGTPGSRRRPAGGS
ncbi:MAG: hypothetical protein ACXV3S_05210 [Kineosporiaceae bacterium]